MQRQVLVDGKVRTDKTYPAGFMGMHRSYLFSC
jgi:ribosomal protein S4E